MLMFKKLRYWIVGGYTIPIFLMIASATVVSVNVGRVQSEAQQLNVSRQIAEDIAEISWNLQAMSRTLRGYLLDNNPTSRSSWNQAKNDANQIIGSLTETMTDENQLKTMEEIRKQYDDLVEFHEGLIQIVGAGDIEAARQTWIANGIGIRVAEDTAKLIDQMKSREAELVNMRVASQSQALNNLLSSVWVSIGLAVIVSIILGSWIITTIVQKITQEANNIALAATEIATTIEEQERVAVQQAASVNETSTSMDELGASSRQCSEQASAASSGARQVLALAGSNRQEDTLDGSPSLREKMSQVQAQILRLSENLSQIYNITNLVSDLANQTNMLALNASVEAVRAGEHGKGFGVVASEIRKLADQSRKSAEKIGSLIADIQNSANSTVIVTEEGTKAVEKIIVSINDVAVNIQQISLNTKQQAMAVEQVIDAMNSLNTAAQETANGLAQSRAGTEQLNNTAQGLKNLV
ncbi:methyl-accepting chemotaxis protein [Limnospira fusiformis]|uniref:methyl-accepting chemotaxis protein n=1 Tax=Limnospira fusiformis TaxID=54297 RepID=UPI002AA1C273|nr:methyl-accepting chemotaxis protein [Limnospira fusiformis LS22]